MSLQLHLQLLSIARATGPNIDVLAGMDPIIIIVPITVAPIGGASAVTMRNPAPVIAIIVIIIAAVTAPAVSHAGAITPPV